MDLLTLLYMSFWVFIIVALPFLGYYIFTRLFDLFFGKNESKTDTFITHNHHHHYHDNRQVHYHQPNQPTRTLKH